MLDDRYALLFIRGERPVMDLKYDILKHPNVKLPMSRKTKRAFLHLTNAGREVAERILRNSGVSEDTIEAFRLYDRQAFNSDRRYRERVQVLFPLPLRRSVIF